MLQADSIAATQAHTTTAARADSTVRHKLTVSKVLSWLPDDATPAQQDSAVRANIKPSPITWSNQPDTLHMPGHPIGKSFRDVSLPQYYRESYFTGKPWFDPDLFGGRLGTAGDPVPYSIARDNVITLLLLACFALAAVGFAVSRSFIVRQAKDFFRVQHGEVTTITETAAEFRFQFFLVFQTCLLLGLLYFFYVQLYVADLFIVEQYAVIGAFAGMFLAYTLAKALAYWVSGWVFFDRKSTEQWMKAYLFILAFEGLSLFPFVMLQAYFGMAVQTTLACSVAVVILFRILTFYKTYIIFFRRNRAYVQNFLYFCTLELMPIVALLGLLGMASNYLKVSF